MRKYLTVIFSLLTISIYSQHLFIPNAFTPDGDGQNDCFGVYCVEKDSINYFSMKIFNSNGECVFLSEDINEKWQGGVEYFSSPKPFVYYIEYKITGNVETFKRKGFVFLIR